MGVSFGEPEPEPQVPYYAANFGYQHLVPPQVDLANAQVKFVWLSSFKALSDKVKITYDFLSILNFAKLKEKV